MTLARKLIEVDRLRETSGRGPIWLFPAALVLMNLFFCAYYERFLRADRDQFHLSLLFFIEGSAYLAVRSAHFVEGIIPILERGRVYPLTPMSRLLFSTIGALRRPTMWGLLLSTVFFLVIFYRHSLTTASGVPGSFLLMVVALETISSVLLLSFSRSQLPVTGLVLLAVMLCGALLAVSIVFQSSSLMRGIPFLSWSISFVRALVAGNATHAAADLALLVGLPMLAVLFGRRYC